jgi:hypothetical protein
MRTFVYFLLPLVIIPVLLLTGCVTPSAEPQITTPASSSVSSIPWNKPASWEGAGALGGMMPQGGH